MKSTVKKKKAPETVRLEQPTHFVAVGASAGGLEAIELFFTNMPPDSGLAFIVVQHLSPDYKSLMVELLSKKTNMPVHRAEDGMLVMPNNVYLIPPKKNLTIFHQKLILSEQDHSRGINLPIDIFIRSLAEDQGEKAIGIILSGTGSDGARGVRAIKEAGGMVMVQSEESAKFDGMPRAAISTGVADFILPPAKLPGQLLAYVKHPYTSKSERSETLLSDEDGLVRIFSLLREKCKVDFTYYKPSTITRRIERRMSITQSDKIKDYVAYMLGYPSEIVSLYRELLIGVTSFFRDPVAFEFLAENVLPELISANKSSEFRLWVAGCSTGEEAYSLAITTRECMERLGVNLDVKIFATDIDDNAIHYAAAGSYPESIAADISPRLLSKYFNRRDDYFQISRTIREMVVFAQHNLLKDPPFTNINLISCRNLLIYLQPVLQNKVLEFFNFSLSSGSALFLGSSESTGDMSEYFEVVDLKSKIYRSVGRVRQFSDIYPVPNINDARKREIKGYFNGSRRSRVSDEEQVLERFISSIAGNLLPLTLIVNELMEIQQIIGDASAYFRLPSGKIVNDISKMAIKELVIPISTGIQKVLRKNQDLRFSNIRIKGNEGTRSIDLRISQLTQAKGHEPLVAVMIEETKRVDTFDPLQSSVTTYDISKETEERLRDLEHELQVTRENLQATVEELETSNEELQATNEELLASNEELQSTNEELQSTNEELFTVNSEYQSKIVELSELHNDIDNLLSATQIGNLILDNNLDVRRFSKKCTDIYKLLDGDIGRPITHLSHYLVDVDPIDVVREVQITNHQKDLEVQTLDGHWYLMRVIPYAIGQKSFSGTVLSFIDIMALKQSENSFRTVLEKAADAVLLFDKMGRHTFVNQNAASMLGYSPHELMSLTTADIAPSINLVERVFSTDSQQPESKVSIETVLLHKDRSIIPVEINAVLLTDGTAYSSCRDITARKAIEERLEHSERFMRKLIDVIPGMVGYWTKDLRCRFANSAYLEWFGKSPEEMIGIHIHELLGDALYRKNEQFILNALEGNAQKYERTMLKHDGSTGHTWAHYIPDREEGTVKGFFVLVSDITELKTAQLQLAQLNEALEQRTVEAESANKAKSTFLANMSHEIRTPMNGLLGMGYLALQQDVSPKVHDYLSKMTYSAESLMGILNDILDFSKIEANMLAIEHVEFSTTQLLENMSAPHRVAAVNKGLEFVVPLPGSYPEFLVGDPLRIQQVIGNLLSNAIKFTAMGLVEYSLTTVEEDRVTNRVKLLCAVRDTGIGIALDQQEQLFLPFTQSDTSISREYGGTGLGLSICRSLVTMMGGELSVQSVPGIGSSFSFSLWLGYGTAAPVLDNQQEVPADRVGGGTSQVTRLDRMSMDLQGVRILLADDNPINTQLASELLEKKGAAVTSVANGSEAVEEVQRTNGAFDLVLMDVRMPVMDGYTATKLIRERWDGERLPIIAVTAHAMLEERERCLRAGMNDLLTKPLNPKTLFMKVGAVTHRTITCDVDGTTLPENSIPSLRLPGLNVEEMLGRCLNDSTLLKKIVTGFIREGSELADALISAIYTGNLENIDYLAHSLKGLSGNIGATSLCTLCKEIEKAVEQKSPLSTIQKFSPVIRYKMDVLLKNIDTVIAMDDAEFVAAERWS